MDIHNCIHNWILDIHNNINLDIFYYRPLLWNCNKYPYFYIFPLEFGGAYYIHKYQNSRILCWNRNNSSVKMPVCPRLHIHRKHAHKFHPNESAQYMVCKPFYINLEKMWLHERDLDAPRRMQRTWWQLMSMPYMGFRILSQIMCIHDLIMGIHNSIMDIHNNRVYSLLAFHISMHI